jgi:hypothetical protein
MRYQSVCSPVLQMMAFNFSRQLKPVGEEIVSYRLYSLHIITRLHPKPLDYVITRELCCTSSFGGEETCWTNKFTLSKCYFHYSSHLHSKHAVIQLRCIDEEVGIIITWHLLLSFRDHVGGKQVQECR